MTRSDKDQSIGLACVAALIALGILAVIKSQPRLEEKIAELKVEFPRVAMLKPAALAEWLTDTQRVQPQLLDVRTPAEFAVSHLPAASHVPVERRARALLATLDTNRPTVLYCTTGYRASLMAVGLEAAGYTNLFTLEGSIFAWANEGRPLVRNGRPVKDVHPYNPANGRMLKPEYRGALTRTYDLSGFHLPLIEQVKFASAIGLLAVLLSWETIAPALPWFRRNGRERAVHGVRNIALGSFNSVVIAIFFVRLWWAMSTWTAAHQFGLLNWLDLSGGSRVLAAVLLLDAWTYSWHRLNHSIGFLWRFHRTHHSEQRVDVTSASRFHFGELILSSLLRLPVIALAGVEFGELVLYETLLFGIVQFHHANIRLAPGVERWLRWVIVTPDFHRVHHSRDLGEAHSNFSSLLSLWDGLFGTWNWRDDSESISFGLEGFDEPNRHTLGGLLKTPLNQAPVKADGQ